MPREPRPDDLLRAAAGEPSDPFGVEMEGIGTVKYWRDAKGNGAISVNRIAPWDIWCSFSAIDAPGFRALTPGARVIVRYRRGQHESYRYVAEWVRELESEDSDTPLPNAG